MSRVKVHFKGLKDFVFKKDFDDHLSFLFHKKVCEIFKDTKFNNFEFFTFSNFTIENFINIGDGFLTKDGIISFIISSIDETFLRSLISAFVIGESINFYGNEFFLINLSFLPKPDFHKGFASFVTISPIFLNNCLVTGNLGDILEDILINNYCKYFNLMHCSYSCEFYSRKEHYDYFQTDIDDLFHDYYYDMDLVIKGDIELISFAYDVGLGNSNNKGFGMLKLY